MSESSFGLVRRGYDPAAVDRHVVELRAELEQALAESDQSVTAASYAQLGERIAQMLTLAEEEATELRERARAEAQALIDEHRERAEAATATFETELAARRRQSADELAGQEAAMQAQLETARAQFEYEREQGSRESESARAEAERVLHGATSRAEEMVAQARATADRVRVESEQELVAASKRRDKINEQLVNVRAMLGALGASPAEAERTVEADQL